jgi:diguanylate cyclase
MGVVGLPRNYEIFYEAMTGSNPRLSAEFQALGPRPRQERLDALSMRYFTQNAQHAVVETAHDQISGRLEEIMSLLGKERTSLEKFGVILDQTSDGLKNRQLMKLDLLHKIVGIMSAATESTIQQGRQIASEIEDKSAELDGVKERLEEYKRLADTDSLTGLWNRRAFDKAMAAIYNDARGIIFNALIIVDIDDFKKVNDRHGHPVGDRILQSVAMLLKAHSGDDVFVARAGGEEFALIVNGITEDAAAGIADSIRMAIEKTRFSFGQSGPDYGPVTVSMGLCMASEATGPDDLYARADRAMYASKQNGRNRLTRHSTLASRTGKNWMLYRKE